MTQDTEGARGRRLNEYTRDTRHPMNDWKAEREARMLEHHEMSNAPEAFNYGMSSIPVGMSWLDLKNAYKDVNATSETKKNMYTRWKDRNRWVFDLVKDVFNNETHTIFTTETLSFSEYETKVSGWEALLDSYEKENWENLESFEHTRENLVITKITTKDFQKVKFEFPFTKSLTSDLDIQFNVHEMESSEFDRLRLKVLTALDSTCLSREYDLNVYIEGDVANYPRLNLQQCKKFLLSKLRRFQKTIPEDISIQVEARVEDCDDVDKQIEEVEKIYRNYYENSLNPNSPLQQEEFKMYENYFDKWIIYKKSSEECSAVNLALFHYLKIEGYVCSASLQFVLETQNKITVKNKNDEFYQIAALENLCDAVIHMSRSDSASFLDKSKYIKRCALALKSSLCMCAIDSESTCISTCKYPEYSCTLTSLNMLYTLSENYDKLRASSKDEDKTKLSKIQQEAPFYITITASVIQNIFIKDSNSYDTMTNIVIKILRHTGAT